MLGSEGFVPVYGLGERAREGAEAHLRDLRDLTARMASGLCRTRRLSLVALGGLFPRKFRSASRIQRCQMILYDFP